MATTKMLKVKDIAESMQCNIKQAYKIVQQSGFPAIRVGKIYLIPEDEYEKWIKRNLGKEFKLY